MKLVGLPPVKAYRLPVCGSVPRPMSVRAPLYMSRVVKRFRTGL
jgi:hypothetical protein